MMVSARGASRWYTNGDPISFPTDSFATLANGDLLFETFTRTRAIRRGIVEIGQDSAAADFGRPHEALKKS